MDSWIRIFPLGLQLPHQYEWREGLMASGEFIVCLPAGFSVWNLQQYTFFSRIASWGGYKNAPYRNHRPVLHSRQSTTPDMDPIPDPQNQNETIERRDHEGTVREAHEGTNTRVLLRQQTTLPRPRSGRRDQRNATRRPESTDKDSRRPVN